MLDVIIRLNSFQTDFKIDQGKDIGVLKSFSLHNKQLRAFDPSVKVAVKIHDISELYHLRRCFPYLSLLLTGELALRFIPHIILYILDHFMKSFQQRNPMILPEPVMNKRVRNNRLAYTQLSRNEEIVFQVDHILIQFPKKLEGSFEMNSFNKAVIAITEQSRDLFKKSLKRKFMFKDLRCEFFHHHFRDLFLAEFWKHV
jgi:hypothetical protein